MRIPGRLIRWADSVNHWRPRQGKYRFCWCRTLCLYETELGMWRDGTIKHPPSWRGAWRTFHGPHGEPVRRTRRPPGSPGRT